MSEEKLNFVRMVSTFSQVDVAMIKSILGDEIVYYFKDENFMSVRPLLEPAILMVREDYVAEVRELLKDYDLKFMGISVKKIKEDEE